MKNDPIDLNDYHKRQSARLAKEISEQPLLSPEESMKQLQRLARQNGSSHDRRQPMSVGK
jgi:hypothetical protein